MTEPDIKSEAATLQNNWIKRTCQGCVNKPAYIEYAPLGQETKYH